MELSILEVVLSLALLVFSSLLEMVLKELEEVFIAPTLQEERINPVNTANALKIRLFFICH